MSVLRFFCICFFILINLYVRGNHVYVSSSNGEDYNSGLTLEKPIKTVVKALSLKVDTIYLKSGDVFYENIQFCDRVITKYGNGANPLLCGFKRVVSNKWEKQEDNIWYLDLNDARAEGHTMNNMNTLNDVIDNIGFFYETEKNIIHGRKVSSISELTYNWDFYQPLNSNQKSYIYLYYDKDPNKIMMEYATGTIGIIMNGGVLDGINVQGFGFGISLRYSGIIRNCRIDAIGGRTLITAKSFICDGNGIGIWVDQNIDTKDVLVEHCYISRVFDAGICLQGSSGGKATAKNVVCRDNLIVNCCQAWEDVLNNKPDKPYENCVFENNYVIHSGKSFWGYYDKRYKYCHILGNNSNGRKNMCFKNNVFIDGNYYCSAIYDGGYMSNLWQENLCYIKKGDYILSHCDGYRDVLRISESNNQSLISEYCRLTGDNSTLFIVKNEKTIQRIARKKIKQYLKHHTY